MEYISKVDISRPDIAALGVDGPTEENEREEE